MSVGGCTPKAAEVAPEQALDRSLPKAGDPGLVDPDVIPIDPGRVLRARHSRY